VCILTFSKWITMETVPKMHATSKELVYYCYAKDCFVVALIYLQDDYRRRADVL